MAEFVNTRDILGMQEALDGLVGDTLTEFNDDMSGSLRAYAFAYRANLQKINMPNISALTNAAVCVQCTALQDAVFSGVLNINGTDMFSNCYKLKNLDLSSLTTIGTGSASMLGNQAGAQNDEGGLKLVFPNLTRVSSGLNNASGLKEVDFAKSIVFVSYGMKNDAILQHVILRSDTICSLGIADAFLSTPIASGTGWIYVPTSLVDEYKSATNWSQYASQIVSISEYPKSSE